MVCSHRSLRIIMAETRKPVARIQVPLRQAQGEPVRQGQGETDESGGPVGQAQSAASVEQVSPDSAQGVHLLMSKGRSIPKRDPLIVPMVGLLLAFSVISLIVQLLIAFS